MTNRIDRGRAAADGSAGGAGAANHDRLIALLETMAGPDGMARFKAREELVAMGSAAVPGLISRLQHGTFRMRWEAAKALSEIGDPTATDALLAALHDRDQDIRWLAAEGLAAIGPAGAGPVLRTLIDQAESTEIRWGIHHVLHEYRDPALCAATAELLRTLGGVANDADVVRLAQEALAELEG